MSDRKPEHLELLLQKDNEKEKELFMEFFRWLIQIHEEESGEINIASEANPEISKKYFKKAGRIVKSLFLI